MDIQTMLDSIESSLELDQQHQQVVVTSVEPSSTVSSSSSSSSTSSTSSASSVEREIIASVIPKPFDCNMLAVGPDEASKHFPSRTPSPAPPIPAVTAAVVAGPPAPPHGARPFEPQPKFDEVESKKDIPVPQQLDAPSSSPTAIDDTSLDHGKKRFSSLEREVAAGDPSLGLLFSKDDEEDSKDVNDASNISVPNYNDSSGSYEPPSNNTSNTSVSIDENEEINESKSITTKRATRSREKSVLPDTAIAGTRASSRLRGAMGSQRGSSKFSEGHTFKTLKEFLEQVSPKLRDNNHHVTIHVEEDFDEDVALSIASASMSCANNKAPISCGCTVVALQKIDEEYQSKMQNRKGYRPRLKWQITVCQPEHCLECLISATNLSEDQIEQNNEAWLADKAHYQNGNKVSITSDNDSEGEEDELDTHGRDTSRRISNKSASKKGRRKASTSARRESSRHPSTSGVNGTEENGVGESDMDISLDEDDNRSNDESDASDEVITVSASFNGPRLSQVKKEGTPYAQPSSSSSKSISRVYRETRPLGPIPGHEGRGSGSKNKHKTSTKAIYGSASSSKRSKEAGSSSAQKKMLPPPCVLRNHAKAGLKNKSKPSSSSTKSTIPSSSLGLRKRSRSESETSDTPEVPQELYGEFPRLSSASRSPAPLFPPPHLLQAPPASARKSASPFKRQRSNRDFSSPKTKFSASTRLSSFHLLPIASEVITHADIKTLGDIIDNGATSRTLLVWFIKYYIYMKFGLKGLEEIANTVNADGGSEDAEKIGQMLKGKEMMQLMAAGTTLGAALAKLEAECEGGEN